MLYMEEGPDLKVQYSSIQENDFVADLKNKD